MNEQTKALVEKGEMLPLMEAFYTIQGEGFHSGKSAYFLRIGGCDVGCHWCDVKESWDSALHPPTHIEKMQESITFLRRNRSSDRRRATDVEYAAIN